MALRSAFLLTLLFTAVHSYAQTTVNGSFMHGGINRTYSFYVPASYNSGTAAPMVIGLHGLSSDGDAFAQYRDFRPVADTAGFIMVHPDGSTMFGIRFWNYGNILGSTVDDVGFLEALIDTISSQYSINHNRIYAAGMSNGSFMSYLLACESDRFAAVGGVTGSMSVDMYDSCNPARPTPAIHVHGTEDPTNPYEGTSTMVGIETMVRFWVDQNNCDTVPAIFPVPDTDPGDGATASRYLYSGGTNGNTVEFFRVNGGEHTWPGWPMPGASDVTCMDFDACVALWRFFSRYTLNGPASMENYPEVAIEIWPNPARNSVNFRSAGHIITNISIADMHGREVKNASAQDMPSMDLGGLQPGIYLAKISGNGFSVVRKLVVTH